ncbi:pogo transposable element with ZNF domain [Trichonephila clavipes]|nr:pogo transposable element with ZNF domain [Trichonephila clavipes]
MLVLGDKAVDFIFTGFRVTKEMLCARANCLFEQQNGSRYSRTGGMSATNGWYRHWVVKWKERGEHIDIEEEEEATPSSSTAVLGCFEEIDIRMSCMFPDWADMCNHWSEY